MSAYEKINALSTRDLADLAKQKNASQFIFISTRAIGSACGAYGLSKEHAEHSIQNSGVAYTIVRVGEAYDTDWSKAEGLGSIATLIDKSPIIPYIASKKPLFAPIHKDDVLDGILATIENPSAYSKTYTLAGPENLTFKEVVERMCKKEKVRRLLLPIPIPLARVGFFILSKIFKRAPQDQLQRLLGAKQGLSKNVDTDLHIHPRLFLAQNK
jgi:NADH dehydrogenase